MSRSIMLCMFFGTVISSANSLSIPTASIKDVDITSCNKHGISFLVKISVKNPFDHDIQVPGVQYFLKSDGRDLVNGTFADPGSLKRKKPTIVDLTIIVPSDILLSLIKDVGRDWDIDYEIGMQVIADFPVVGDLGLPLSYKGTLNLPSWQLLLLL